MSTYQPIFYNSDISDTIGSTLNSIKSKFCEILGVFENAPTQKIFKANKNYIRPVQKTRYKLLGWPFLWLATKM